jgi:hypothetical protein
VEGLGHAYGRLHSIVLEMPELCWIEPPGIKLLGPDDPIGKDLVAIDSGPPRLRAYPSRWAGRRVGDMGIEGAYVYPLPSSVTA